MTIEKYIGREQINDLLLTENDIRTALKEYVADAAELAKIINEVGAPIMRPEALTHLWRSCVPSFAVYLIEREHVKRKKAERARVP